MPLEEINASPRELLDCGATVMRGCAFFRPTTAAEPILCALSRSAELDSFMMHLAEAPVFGDANGEPFPFQDDGASLILGVEGRGLILGDEVGMGKTVTTCHMLRRCGHARKTIIVAINAVLYSWEDHIHEWLPGMDVFVCEGEKTVRDEAIANWLASSVGALVIGWDNLRYHPELAEISVDWAIADDCYKMTNPKAKRTRAFLSLKADRRAGLAGTLPDEPQKLFTLLQLCNPKKYKSYWEFIKRVCHMRRVPWGSGVEFKGLKDPESFAREIAPYIVRRKKEDFLDIPPMLPPKVLRIPLSSEQLKVYADLKADMIAEYEGQVIDAATALVLITRLLQVASNLINVFDYDVSSKADALMQVLDMMDGHKVVILTPWRPVVGCLYHRCKAHGRTPVIMVGGMSASEKHAAKQEFQQGEADTFIATAQTAASGLTLTASNVLVWESLPWSRYYRPEGDARIHRISQQRVSQTIRMIAAGTVEERVQRKQERGDAARDGMYLPFAVLREEFGDSLMYAR